jgi:hypothetical protein
MIVKSLSMNVSPPDVKFPLADKIRRLTTLLLHDLA